jgi:prepilin-type N-terminal cleavage/methylation domain-containing protein
MKHKRGFSLVELLVVLIVVGIMAAISINPLIEVMADYSVRTARDELMTHIEYTQSEAIKRGATRVTIAPISANWANGWQIFLDTNNDGIFSTGETLLRNNPRGTGNLTIATTTTDVSCGVNPTVQPFPGYISFVGPDNVMVFAGANVPLLGCLKISTANYPGLSQNIVLSYNGRLRSKKSTEQ